MIDAPNANATQQSNQDKLFLSFCPDLSSNPTKKLRMNFREIPDQAEAGRLICKYDWSPIIFKDFLRAEDNFLAAQVCALDFDDPETSIDNVLEQILDLELWHILATTKSHQTWKKNAPPCDRFRLLLLWEKPILDKMTYNFNLNALIDFFHSDKAAGNAARFFYRSKEVISSSDGNKMEVVAPPKEKPRVPCAPGERRMTRRFMDSISAEVPVGFRDKTAFFWACCLFECGLKAEEVLDVLVDSGVKSLGVNQLKLKVKSAMRRKGL